MTARAPALASWSFLHLAAPRDPQAYKTRILEMFSQQGEKLRDLCVIRGARLEPQTAHTPIPVGQGRAQA